MYCITGQLRFGLVSQELCNENESKEIKKINKKKSKKKSTILFS